MSRIDKVVLNTKILILLVVILILLNVINMFYS
jgi:hypothetical protein